MSHIISSKFHQNSNTMNNYDNLKGKIVVAMATIASGLLCCCGSENAQNSHNVDYIAVQIDKNEGWSIIDKNGDVVVKDEYDANSQLSNITDGVYWVKDSNGYQLFSLDSPKKALTNEVYEEATDFAAGRAVVIREGSPIQIVNTKGEVVKTLSRSITKVYPFNPAGYAVFYEGDKKGVIDTEGNVTFKGNYSYLSYISDRYSELILADSGNGTYLILDKDGQEHGKFSANRYHPICTFSEGLIAVVESSDPYPDNSLPVSFINEKGEKQFALKKSQWKIEGHTIAHYLIDGYIVYASNSNGLRYGVADKDGNEVIRPKYENMYHIGKGFFLAKKNEKWGVINTNDDTLVPFDYDEARDQMLGDNFLLKQEDYFYIVGRDGKELKKDGFYNLALSPCNNEVTFVDLDCVAEDLIVPIQKFSPNLKPETILTAMGEELSTKRTTSSYITQSLSFEKLDEQYNIAYHYNGMIAYQKTHEETYNDGWFDQKRTISDGLAWSDVQLVQITVSCDLSSRNITSQKLFRCLKRTLIQKGFHEVDPNSFLFTNDQLQVVIRSERNGVEIIAVPKSTHSDT